MAVLAVLSIEIYSCVYTVQLCTHTQLWQKQIKWFSHFPLSGPGSFSYGPITPKEESCAKQTQIMLLGGWSIDDVAPPLIEIGLVLEALLRRYSWKKMPQIYSLISHGLDARWRNRYYRSNRWAAVVCWWPAEFACWTKQSKKLTNLYNIGFVKMFSKMTPRTWK